MSKNGIHALAAMAATALCAMALSGCSPALAVEEQFSEPVSDVMAEMASEPSEPQGAARVVEEQERRATEARAEEAEDAPQEPQDAAWDEVWAEPDPEPAWDDYGAYSGPVHSSDFDFMRDGVARGDDGTVYKWYSSNILYHYRTPEWNLDDDGFYHTGDGYYVVASSDYTEGTVVDTPWGEGMVLDSGCDSGTVDMYVNWL